MSEWRRVWSSEHAAFYYANLRTHETSWDENLGLASAGPSAAAAPEATDTRCDAWPPAQQQQQQRAPAVPMQQWQAPGPQPAPQQAGAAVARPPHVGTAAQSAAGEEQSVEFHVYLFRESASQSLGLGLQAMDGGGLNIIELLQGLVEGYNAQIASLPEPYRKFGNFVKQGDIITSINGCVEPASMMDEARSALHLHLRVERQGDSQGA